MCVELFDPSASFDAKTQIQCTTRRSQLSAETSSSPSCNSCRSTKQDLPSQLHEVGWLNHGLCYWFIWYYEVYPKLCGSRKYPSPPLPSPWRVSENLQGGGGWRREKEGGGGGGVEARGFQSQTFLKLV